MIESKQHDLRSARNAGLSLLSSAFLFSIFTNVLLLVGPLFMLQIYDRVLASRSEETLFSLLMLVAALYAIYGLLDFARARVMTRYAARFQALLDQRVFDAVLDAARSGTGGKVNGLRHLETVQNLFASSVMTGLFDLVWSPFFVLVIFLFHPMLGAIAIGGVLVLAVLAVLNNLATRRRLDEARAASATANALADTAARHAALVQSQGMQAPLAARWRMRRDEALALSTHASDMGGLISAGAKSFRLFLQSAILAAGALLTLRGELTAGAIVAGSIILGRALGPVEQTLAQWPAIQAGLSSWRALATLLADARPEEMKLLLRRPEPHLSVQNLSVRRGAAASATLTQLSFDVGPGKVLGVIGKSGAGKSTLAETLVGLRDPMIGEIRIGGATPGQYRRGDLASYVGYMPQTVTLFDGTVAENIARMAPQPDPAKVIAAATTANAHAFILQLPDGYQTQISQAEGRLSGGQLQRIALARALYGDPVLLVLDEPNSALDADGSQALNRAIRTFKETNRAVVVMTHRPVALSECDDLIVLEQGRIVSSGPRDDVLKAMLHNAGDVRKLISLAVSK